MTERQEASIREDIKELREKAGEHTWLPLHPIGAQRDPETMAIFVSADGVRVTDVEGRSYIDGFSCLMYKNIGHGRREIADAVHSQMLEMTSAPQFHFATVPGIELATKLAEITPGSLSRVHYVCGGSEANEVAVKMARQYQRIAGSSNRFKIIARQGEYHGFTQLMMALGKSPLYGTFEPFPPGVRYAPQPHCYRCPLELEYPHCGIGCAKSLGRIIEHEGPDTVAAFLTTSVSQAAGGVVPPPEYWPMVRSICDKYGVLFIDDEVVCGFGRTGKMFGIENFGVNPDIMTFAKGVTSGYLPLGGAIVSKEISEKFEESKELLRSVTTFGGLPASCAAALANIAIIEQENLVKNAASMGEYIAEQVQSLKEHPMVGDIRGLGLLWFIELVKDRQSKERLSGEESGSLVAKLRQAGLITRGDGGLICFVPPLVITKEEIDESLAIIDRAIGELEEEAS